MGWRICIPDKFLMLIGPHPENSNYVAGLALLSLGPEESKVKSNEQ